MAEETKPAKWQGKATTELASLTPEQVWPCLEDFCNLHKWLPSIDTCYLVDGVPGQPGMVRYCASTKPSSQGSDEMTVTWVKEKLITIDPIQRCFSYEVTDNNIGIKTYVATIKVFSVNDDSSANGCTIEWSFVADPLEGWRFEDLISYVDDSLQNMAKKMEHALLQTG